MKSNGTKKTSLSPNSHQQTENDKLLSLKQENAPTYVKVTQRKQLRKRPTQNILSPLKTGLNQTAFSVQTKSNELNQSISTFRKKKATRNPKVSNYSEDLNLMMESYFSKKLKEIRTNIAQLDPKETKGSLRKTNNSPRFFSPKVKKEQKNPISVISKAIQNDALNLSNEMRKKKEGRNGIKFKTMGKLQKPKISSDIKRKDNHSKKCSHNINKSSERRNKSISQDKINQSETIKSNKKNHINVRKNTNAKFSGAKFQYYRNDNCIHTVALDKFALNNLKSINKHLQDFFRFVFKKEVNVNVSFKNICQPNEQCVSLRESNFKRQDESENQLATLSHHDQSEIILSSPLLQEKYQNENNLTEASLLENNQSTSHIKNNTNSLINAHDECIQELNENDNVKNMNMNDKDAIGNEEMKSSQESNKSNIEKSGIETETEPEPVIKHFEEEISKYNKTNEEMIQNIKELEEETEPQQLNQ